ncbi:MAG: class I SAM-dependent methyltransferase [Patescibacteria group bacterium]
MSESEREALTKEHIRNLVENYDEIIRKLIPQYEEMQQSVLGFLDFPADIEIAVLDLGIGTGETAQRILEAFPKSKIIGIDLSQEMVEGAKQRLAKYPERVELTVGNMADVELPESVDAIVSTLAIHHLTGEQKRALYQKLYRHLQTGGVLSLGDLVTFQDPKKAARTEQDWKDFIFGTLGQEQGQFRFDEYKKGDIPSPLESQIEWLKEAGFQDVSVNWELMNYAVFGGRKIEK